jgi:AcrR family transcriptional regulator
MPPSARFGKEEIVEAALQIVHEGGIAQLSARNVADKMGASTAPIYSCFPSMEELVKAVYLAANDRMLEYMTHQWTNALFLNMGIGMTLLARDEPNFYKMLHFEIPPFEYDAPAERERYLALMENDPLFSGMPRELLMSLLQTMTIVTNGLAAYVCIGKIQDVTAKWVADWLEDVGGAIIADVFVRTGKEPPSEYIGVEPVIINDAPPPQRFYKNHATR